MARSADGTGTGKSRTTMSKNQVVTYLRNEDGRSFFSSAFALSGCWGRKSMIDFVDGYPDGELRIAKNRQFVKVSGFVERKDKLSGVDYQLKRLRLPDDEEASLQMQRQSLRPPFFKMKTITDIVCY